MADMNHAGFAFATLNPKGQTLDTVQKIVANILNHVGCPACGRLASLRIDLLGDPPAELARQSVISFQVFAGVENR